MFILSLVPSSTPHPIEGVLTQLEAGGALTDVQVLLQIQGKLASPEDFSTIDTDVAIGIYKRTRSLHGLLSSKTYGKEPLDSLRTGVREALMDRIFIPLGIHLSTHAANRKSEWQPFTPPVTKAPPAPAPAASDDDDDPPEAKGRQSIPPGVKPLVAALLNKPEALFVALMEDVETYEIREVLDAEAALRRKVQPHQRKAFDLLMTRLKKVLDERDGDAEVPV